MASLTLLKTERGRFRTSLTRIHADKGNFHTYDSNKFDGTKLKLENIEKQLTTLNDKVSLELINADQADIDVEMDSREDYEDKLIECRVCINELIQFRAANAAGAAVPSSGHQTGTGVGAPSNLTSARSTLLKRPVAPLPTFTSSEGENFVLFSQQFQETVDLFGYTERDKVLLLKQQVSGRASLLLKSIEPGKDTLNDVLEMLTEALASKDVQKFSVIKQLTELHLPPNGEPFEYISAVKSIMK